jgi:hypothetical protein
LVHPKALGHKYEINPFVGRAAFHEVFTKFLTMLTFTDHFNRCIIESKKCEA